MAVKNSKAYLRVIAEFQLWHKLFLEEWLTIKVRELGRDHTEVPVKHAKELNFR